MTITPLHSVVHYKDKHSLVKGLVYLKLLEKGIYLPNNVLNVLALFGISTNKDWVTKMALEYKFYKSAQVVDNTISTLVGQELLKKGKEEKVRTIPKDIFPLETEQYTADCIAATLKVHNIQSN